MTRRVTVAAILLGAILWALARLAVADGSRVVRRIVIDGTINPTAAEFLRTSIREASAEDAEALLVELDTPGGVTSSMQESVRQILNSPVPVVVYVTPRGARAASAGTFVLLAAHVAAMAPGTYVGAARPMQVGEAEVGGSAPKEAEKETAAFMESIAKQRGRNADWTVKAVRQSLLITEDGALKLHVIDVVASSARELLDRIDGRRVTVKGAERELRTRGASIITGQMSFSERLINAISHPNVAVLLFLAALLGLYVEFTHPGLIFPGLLGGVFLHLFFLATEAIPYNATAFVLVALGVVLLVAELFVTSFGFLFVGGIVLLTFGLLLLFDTPQSDLRVSFGSILFPAILALSIFGGIVVYNVTRARLAPPRMGLATLVGALGVARSDISMEGGKIFVGGEWWNAVSDEPVRTGDRVIVTEVKDMVLKVRTAQEEEA